METSTISLLNSNVVEEQAKNRLSKIRQERESERQTLTVEKSHKQDPLSSLFLYVIRKKDLQALIPDYELYTCRQLFSSGTTHESYFGLARLLAFEGRFHQALRVLNSAIQLNADSVYKNWRTVLRVKVANKAEEVEEKNQGFFGGFICCGFNKKNVGISESIEEMPESVEKWWSYMELSMKGIGELEPPQYFAAKIKEIDPYFGYLAWSEVMFRRNEWQVALDIVKELIRVYGTRPEAYIKLWQHYYYVVKDYEQAEDTASEAVLKCGSHDLHNYYILFCLFSAKTQFKLKHIKECLDFLQRKFIENPTYPIFLYYYGRYCAKSEDYMFIGSAIGALHESLRLCDNTKYGLIYYWLSRAYMLGRQYIDAYDKIRLAMKYLDSSYVRKISQLKRWQADIQDSILKIQEIENLLGKNFDEASYKKCKRLCYEVKDLHKLTVDVLYAKMLWKLGRFEEALKKLYAVSGISTVKMNAYFLLLKYLEAQDNLKCMKTVATEMIVKCKNPQVPSHIWMKANLLYARVLVKNNKPGKAILVLKCLAKLLPPMPFVDIKYTKLLQRAASIQDLTSAHDQVVDTLNAYSYSTYKNSFMTTCYNVREFSQKLIAEEAAPLPMSTAAKMNQFRKSQRTITEKYNNPRRYGKRKTAEFKEAEENKELTILGVTIPNLMDFKGFSISSQPIFLYKIAKIAEKFGICLQDGLCAVVDYEQLLKLEKDALFREKQKKKVARVKNSLEKKLKDFVAGVKI